MNTFIPIFIFLSLIACHSQEDTEIKVERPIAEVTPEVEDIHEIEGYRFKVKGDFNGDGKKEWLNEHFFSGITEKETNKFYEGISYDSLVELTVDKEPWSFVTCSEPSIDTLSIGYGGQLLGLSLLKNEGDLDGNGTDEISYVVNHADWSSMNSCHIMTYAKNSWQRIHSFEIRDWELPFDGTMYGFFGVTDRVTDPAIEDQYAIALDTFSGFIHKIKDELIAVQTYDFEAMSIIDTVKISRF